MMQNHYELDGTILKSNAELTLCRTDRVSVEIKKGTLAVAIRRSDRKEGYVFLGDGKLLVDAIVETEKGAVGKPVQRQLNEPFIMLGNTDDASQHLDKATDDDLKRMGLNEKTFLGKAQDLLAEFTGKRMAHGSECFGVETSLF